MKQMIKFTLLAYGISWLFWLIAYGITSEIIHTSINSELFMILGRFGPSVAGIIILSSNVKLKEILKNTFQTSKKLKYVFFAFFALPIMNGLIYLVLRHGFDYTLTSEWLAEPFTILILYAYILILGGPLGEEIGWRGYLLPKLMNRYNVLVASLILGLIWTFWHLPTFFIEGNVQNDIPFSLYTLYTICLTIWITLLVLKTKKIGTAICLHTSANFGLGIFYVLQVKTGLVLLGVVMISSIIITIVLNRRILFSKVSLNYFDQELPDKKSI